MKNKLKPDRKNGTVANIQIVARAQAKFKEALAQHQIGQFARAQDIYFQVLGIKPAHFEALFMLGMLAGQAGDFSRSLEWIEKAIGVNPASAAAHSNRGNALTALKRYEAAIESYDTAIALMPEDATAYFNRGIALGELQLHQSAVDSYEQAVAINSQYADAHYNLGIALNELKKYQAAIASYDRAIALRPDHAHSHIGRGIALSNLKQYKAALDCYNRATTIQPDSAQAYFNSGIVLNELKEHQAAIDNYDRAIAIQPESAQAYYNRGAILSELNQYQAAIDSYDKAISLQPDHVEAHNLRGIALNELKFYKAAIKSYDRAIEIQPDYAEAYTNRGITLSQLRLHAAAVDNYDKAISIAPDSAEAYANRGIALGQLKQYLAAIDSCDKALALKPDSDFLHGVRLHTKMQICDWRNGDDQTEELLQLIRSGEKASQPLTVLALTTSVSLQRKAAEIWVNGKYPENSEMGSVPRRSRHQNIRVGYFSMDFKNHPVSRLTAGLFETHDRSRFEVYAFSFGSRQKDEMRVRVEQAFGEYFLDVEDKSDREIVELARQKEIDIAIDLGGLTGDSRTNIFAMRAAPIQINYIGYPGTMGASYMDYLIADKHLVPAEARTGYSEKIVYLPSFQANDDKRKLSDKVFARGELGLPEVGFVFCCFNNNYKITPATFDCWMRILKKVNGSVLLLYAENEQVSINLRKEISARGVAEGRLVFCKALPYAEHLARCRAADLFLDTLPFNAGTTASDALWAGLPVLTCAGEAFASRMGASLLNAIGLAELITSTQEEYERLAVDLATHPQRLKNIRLKLEENRLTTPLFDTQRFTTNLEAAFTRVYDRYHADLLPDHIWVDASNESRDPLPAANENQLKNHLMGRIMYFCPDFVLPSGGIKVLYRHVFQLNRMGLDAYIIHHNQKFSVTWHDFKVPVLSLDESPEFTSKDILVFPEGMVDLIKSTKQFKCIQVIIPLNPFYIYRSLPAGEDWNDYGITQIITPSPVIKEFVEWSMGISVTLIDEYIDTERYCYQAEKKIKQIVYMPRKSPTGDLLHNILRKKGGLTNSYRWSRLLDLNEDDYASQLIQSTIYLSITSQEGANISVLEAMSAGCLVIGFAGVGGKAFMVGHGPEQNCILVENEDILALGRAVESAVLELENDPHHFANLLQNGILTAGQYFDMDKEARCLKSYFEELLAAL